MLNNDLDWEENKPEVQGIRRADKGEWDREDKYRWFDVIHPGGPFDELSRNILINKPGSG